MKNPFYLLVAGLTVALLATQTAHAEPWTKIADIPQPIGVACMGDGPGGIEDRLVVLSYQGNGGLYIVDENGNPSFRTVNGLPQWRNTEVYVAVSPGLGDWPLSTVYLIHGGTIYRLNDDLDEANVFASFGGKPNTHSGIAFDRTGVWGFDMVVTFRDGSVYTLDASGVSTYVGTAGVHHEQPRVMTDDPARWGSYAGCISTSSETANRVYGFCPDGSVSVIANNITNAESSDVRPSSGEVTFGNTPYVFVLSAYSRGAIVGYRGEQMPAGSEGDLFVSQEGIGGVVRVTAPGSTIRFAQSRSEHYEGSNFCFLARAIDTTEDCEDGIDNDGDGFIDYDDPDCHVCGNGHLDPGEECDDGNVVDGDGCASDCQITDADDDGVPTESDCDDSDPAIGSLLYQNGFDSDTGYFQEPPQLSADPWVHANSALSSTDGGQQATLGQPESWGNVVVWGTVSASATESNCGSDCTNGPTNRWRAGFLVRAERNDVVDEGFHGYRCALSSNATGEGGVPYAGESTGHFLQVAEFINAKEDDWQYECNGGPNPTFDELGKEFYDFVDISDGGIAEVKFMAFDDELRCDMNANGQSVSVSATGVDVTPGRVGLSTLNMYGNFHDIKVCELLAMPSSARAENVPTDKKQTAPVVDKSLTTPKESFLDDYHPEAFPEEALDTSGCRVGSEGMAGWLLFGLLGAVFMLRRRRS